MSGKQVGKVYDHAISGSDQQVALALAEKAEHDGTEIRPAVTRIMWMTGLGKTAVKDALRRMRESGFLKVSRQGGGKGNPTVYEFDWSKAESKIPYPKFRERELKGSFNDPKDKGVGVDPKGSSENAKGSSEGVKGSAIGGPDSSLDPSSFNSSTSRGGAVAPVPVEKDLVDEIYKAMKQAGMRFTSKTENFGFHIGRAQDMFKNDSPTDEEVQQIPDAFVRLFNIKGRADAQGALVELRRQRARKQIIEVGHSESRSEQIGNLESKGDTNEVARKVLRSSFERGGEVEMMDGVKAMKSRRGAWDNISDEALEQIVTEIRGGE